ncbi:uncharacterized protein LOC133309137 [Gastrolobium bilobum]|uniref:uncharacterized protein LOC133309137 n=1 Tax=Gastrolobium bilobum TaxID=150636 RepID=UPI002AB03D9D|nr:uncharacterized protein LOC133309137 [Gastrolobium bilobum]
MNEMRADRTRHRRDDSPPRTSTVTPTPTPSFTPSVTTDPTYVPHTSADPTSVAQTSGAVEQVVDDAANEQRLISFRKHKPPAFLGSKDPKEVTTWLRGMDKIFQVMRDVREAKQGEFDKLVQDTMTVDAYVAKFNELVKFANYGGMLPTPEFLSAKFQRGLNEKIAKRMSNTAVRNFADLVTQCKRVETVYSRYPKSTAIKDNEIKKTANSNSSWKYNKGKGLLVKQSTDRFKRGGNPKSENTDKSEVPWSKCDTCGKIHGGTCWYKQNVCFKCGKPGHFANECTTRKEVAAMVRVTAEPQKGNRIYTLESLNRGGNPQTGKMYELKEYFFLMIHLVYYVNIFA